MGIPFLIRDLCRRKGISAESESRILAAYNAGQTLLACYIAVFGILWIGQLQICNKLLHEHIPMIFMKNQTDLLWHIENISDLGKDAGYLRSAEWQNKTYSIDEILNHLTG